MAIVGESEEREEPILDGLGRAPATGEKKIGMRIPHDEIRLATRHEVPDLLLPAQQPRASDRRERYELDGGGTVALELNDVVTERHRPP